VHLVGFTIEISCTPYIAWYNTDNGIIRR